MKLNSNTQANNYSNTSHPTSSSNSHLDVEVAYRFSRLLLDNNVSTKIDIGILSLGNAVIDANVLALSFLDDVRVAESGFVPRIGKLIYMVPCVTCRGYVIVIQKGTYGLQFCSHRILHTAFSASDPTLCGGGGF